MYGGSDFRKRKEVAFAKRTLKDNRPSSQFKIEANGTYANDPEEKLYEIYESEADGRRYLVFLLSIFKISMAYDEELMMKEVDIGLSITPEQGPHSLVTNFQYRVFAIAATAVVVIAFFLSMYFFVLPAHIKDKVFGFNSAKNEQPASKQV